MKKKTKMILLTLSLGGVVSIWGGTKCLGCSALTHVR